MTSTVYVNRERTVMVREWENGVVEVMTREQPEHTWGPPVHVEKEQDVCTCSPFTAYSTETAAGVALDAMRRRYRDVQARISRCECGMYHLTGTTA